MVDHVEHLWDLEEVLWEVDLEVVELIGETNYNFDKLNFDTNWSTHLNILIILISIKLIFHLKFGTLFGNKSKA